MHWHSSIHKANRYADAIRFDFTIATAQLLTFIKYQGNSYVSFGVFAVEIRARRAFFVVVLLSCLLCTTTSPTDFYINLVSYPNWIAGILVFSMFDIHHYLCTITHVIFGIFAAEIENCCCCLPATLCFKCKTTSRTDCYIN